MKRNWKSISLRILGIIFILFVLLFIGLSVFIGWQIFQGSTQASPRIQTIENKRFYQDEFDQFESEHDVQYFSIPSSQFDHDIPGYYVPVSDSNNEQGVVLLNHGMGGTKESLYDIAEIFLDLNYSVVAIDQRNAGENTAPTNSLGILESYDILDTLSYIENDIAYNGTLILWGESYGGASSAIALGRNVSQVDLLILDCPVSDGQYFVDQVLEPIEEETGLPATYMKWTSNPYFQINEGYTLDEAPVGLWLDDTSTPTLIFNSSLDDITPERMGQEIYQKIPHDQKELVTTDKSGHIEMRNVERDDYVTHIENFLAEYN